MTWDDVFQLIDHVVSVTIVSGSVLYLIFQTWVKEAVKHKFAKAVNAELEEQKHKLNRELEAYKMSLLQELEKFRAGVDIRRSIELQRASAKLEALRKLFTSINTWVNLAVSYPVHTPDVRAHAGAEFNEATEETRLAYRQAELFLTNELRERISTLYADLHTLAISFTGTAQQLAQDDEQLAQFMLDCINISNSLRQEVEAVAI